MAFLEVAGLGKIHYHEYGNGTKVLFAFHGYGLLGDQFNVLEKSVLQEFKVIAFDHFFHGTSTLYEVNEASIVDGMNPAFINAYIENWFHEFGKQRFSLMGYSIGANMVLTVIESFADLIEEVILIAPDGLVPHKGFRFLRTSFIGKKIFKKLTHSNWMMMAALNALKNTKVIDESLHAIASREVDSPEKRLNAYFIINFLKQIQPDIQQIAGLINQYQIRCRLFFGEFDELFPQSNSNLFLSLLDRPELYVLPAGHWLITSELDDYLAQQNYDHQQQASNIL